ncbi:MAG: OadG family protein [Alphaproteobacteria bacterium]|nr:OadG family protein [Alphaproteobacteria bacterium]
MIEALFITLTGMGGVFAFLLLLVLAMNILRFVCAKINSDTTKLDKVALAIALTQRGK